MKLCYFLLLKSATEQLKCLRNSPQTRRSRFEQELVLRLHQPPF